MISLGGLLLGVINIIIVVVVLLLIGAIIMWVMGYLGWAPPQLVQRLYIAVVALIALYMLVRLLLGVPFTIIGGHQLQTAPDRPFPFLAYRAFNPATHSVEPPCASLS